ncbi:MAG: methyltransferase domain-containing protein [Opitutae bacterium]|nr:methyltransferase domain-containing protein [Opitutae bacterium]
MEESQPSRPEFWDTRYAAGQTPWDFGGVPRRLHEFLQAHPAGGTVLIPGCGFGHELTAFAAAGWRATAVDFSRTAVEQARTRLGAPHAERVMHGDFFHHDFADAPFDLIYERTFFCALPPAQRTVLVQRAAHLLKPGDTLAGFFYYGTEPGGPPYALDPAAEPALFRPHFVTVRDEPVADSPPMFAGKERWQERRRS